MKRVMVKKRKIEKQFDNMKLIYMIYNVCEVIKNEDGTTEFNVFQIYDVIESYDLEDIDELFAV